MYLANAVAVLPASPAAERALRQTRNTIAGACVPVMARGRSAGAETKIVRNVDCRTEPEADVGGRYAPGISTADVPSHNLAAVR